MNCQKYTKYTPIDFLKDDSFLEWQLHGKESAIQFWTNVIDQYPEIEDRIEEAILLYKRNVRFNDFRLLKSEKKERVDSLQKEIRKKKKAKKRLTILKISAAASIAILFSLVFFLEKRTVDDDIIKFAKTVSDTDLSSNETQLILSENKIVTLADKESTVHYENDIIKINEDSLPKEKSYAYNQLITPYGKRSTITFSDGTKVWLDAGSKLIYPTEFEEDEREIYIDGEIYLEVAKDSKRPFVVKTDNMSIKVLGTKFNVSAYKKDNAQSVVLLEGSVAVSSEKKRKEDIILEPNQMYLNEKGNESIKEVDASIYALWIKGLYHFENETLDNIIVRVERYYGVEVRCDQESSKLLCSGKLDLKENIDKLLIELCKVLPITYEQIERGKYTIKSK